MMTHGKNCTDVFTILRCRHLSAKIIDQELFEERQKPKGGAGTTRHDRCEQEFEVNTDVGDHETGRKMNQRTWLNRAVSEKHRSGAL